MAGNKKPQVQTKRSRLPKSQEGASLLVETKVYQDAKALEAARQFQDILPWMSMENFRDGIATDADWRMLQFWLYYAEALVSLYDYEIAWEKLEQAEWVSEGIAALYAAGRRFNDSGFTKMRMTPMEMEMVREALLVGDAFKAITEPNRLAAVGRHVQRVLNVPRNQ